MYKNNCNAIALHIHNKYKKLFHRAYISMHKNIRRMDTYRTKQGRHNDADPSEKTAAMLR